MLNHVALGVVALVSGWWVCSACWPGSINTPSHLIKTVTLRTSAIYVGRSTTADQGARAQARANNDARQRRDRAFLDGPAGRGLLRPPSNDSILASGQRATAAALAAADAKRTANSRPPNKGSIQHVAPRCCPSSTDARHQVLEQRCTPQSDVHSWHHPPPHGTQ